MTSIIKSTPVKQVNSPSEAVTDSPGNWKHPRLAEITARRNRTTFSQKNVLQIAYNIGAMVVVKVVRNYVVPRGFTRLLPPPLSTHSTWITVALYLIPLLNIVLALLPLVRKKDDFSDIPLTPAQRKLLGLPPSSAPPTPNSTYSTPPRYSRTSSLAGSPASIRSYNSSPLSFASPSPATYGSPSKVSPHKLSTTSQYSPSGAVSPLLQKAVAGGSFNGRRSSFGASSNLGSSTASSLFGGEGPATPTPVNGKRSSVALNSKWLYEKGRRNSSNSWLHQGA
ncbi:nuclear pore complex component-domain-containing protein [Podospora australis]|uniref:Nuclear pore complex component-domain-containing protein n=1 Tax=Podospora australis TaxID=1536484 RepID=A0AAN7ALB6_9PEZI|nr:nuclear pore complex component-domain-containing protein [Podospora australis]